jgi:hypothetical protein
MSFVGGKKSRGDRDDSGMVEAVQELFGKSVRKGSGVEIKSRDGRITDATEVPRRSGHAERVADPEIRH